VAVAFAVTATGQHGSSATSVLHKNLPAARLLWWHSSSLSN